MRATERARYFHGRFLLGRLEDAQHLDLGLGIEPVARLALGERRS